MRKGQNTYDEPRNGRVLVFKCEECESGQNVTVERNIDGDFEVECTKCGEKSTIITSYTEVSSFNSNFIVEEEITDKEKYRESKRSI